MGKWIIPRHKPRSPSEVERCDSNRRKVKCRKFAFKKAREAKERERNIAFLDLVMQQNNEEKSLLAQQVIGQCERKKKLSLERAKQCARSAALETGKTFYVYKCKWCNAYHLTRNPIEGGNYEFIQQGLGNGGRK